MSLLSTILRRFVLLAFVVAGVAIVTFTISHLIPGDPAQLIAGDKASAETLAHVRQELGLDKPVTQQFVIYVKQLLSGDLGNSLRTRRPVATDIALFLPATLELGITALIMAILIGVPLGVLSAIYKDGPVDQAARAVSVAGISMPVFWFGLALIIVFYVKIPILPGSARIDIGIAPPPRVTGFFLIDSLVAGDLAAFRSTLYHLVLPAFVLAFANLGIITRQIRASMLDVLQEDYVRTARANGLSRSAITLRHALPNALIPSVTLLGLAFGDLLYGAVLTETIFAWPGMGSYVVSSIQTLDFPAIMGFTIVASLGYVLINLAVDLTYMVLDPQIRELG
ncbi:ABC transporter permease [Mesorhizobium sp. VK25A]|uniref:ABC transporter permease n=1 Tax=Mesorhizobium vachelliae TaxID=3072309 RepID=A0ABU5AC91_9HYPH|nr:MULTISPECIES: ABC transporter permease [unclassified Mesorhizobium]MDX8534159.1 ABC transporter permease [Mesorhizobium sp. VK25D]MDX8546728.1 ABC transporter permease [Mesorhizobium sp. VK25A]